MRNRRLRNKPNAKGRNTVARYSKLEHRIIRSPAFRALSTNSRSLLMELIFMYNGYNNGSIYLSVRDAADRMGVADLTAASNAFNELQDMGLIECMDEGSFHVKASSHSRARMWRLTFHTGPGNRLPTMDYENCEPTPGTKARRRMEAGLRVYKRYYRNRDHDKFPVLDFATDDPFRRYLGRNPVAESNTAPT